MGKAKDALVAQQVGLLSWVYALLLSGSWGEVESSGAFGSP